MQQMPGGDFYLDGRSCCARTGAAFAPHTSPPLNDSFLNSLRILDPFVVD